MFVEISLTQEIIFRSHYVRPSRTQKTLSGHLRYASASPPPNQTYTKKTAVRQVCLCILIRHRLVSALPIDSVARSLFKKEREVGGKKTFSSFINHRSKQPIQ